MKDSTSRLLAGLARDGARALLGIARRARPHGREHAPQAPDGGRAPVETHRLPDFDYAPHRDGEPDPGEVVWTWVPYEDDPTRGKDRPVLVLARSGRDVVVAQLTSQDHDLDAADEARWGRYWMDIGTGDWDSRRRPSEVRLDRLIRVAPDTVRREGGILDERIFREVVSRVEALHGAG
ncbi:MAG: type II toxin-antitoxin system PemK/MazF family toxin [Actinobacteria bacterium]|nr:type II toxin-antitoxin system PemK/MazF family toxin [Actinomycetota bacterium]